MPVTNPEQQQLTLAPLGLPPMARVLPGLFLSIFIAGLAYGVHLMPGFGLFSPLVLAIMIGMAFHNLVGTPQQAKAGIKFSLKRILRAGIVLLGLQLTLSQVVAVGGAGLAIIALTLVSTFMFTLWLGRVLKVDRKLTELIAAGTSICGASAVLAANAVTRGKDEDVAYAVACVTVFGTLSMLIYPMAAGVLAMSSHQFGLWAGSSIHEVAQVIAAAYQRGEEAGNFGTIAKLTRVMMLAPTVLALEYFTIRRRGDASGSAEKAVPAIPWFVIGFIAMVGLASTGWLPERVIAPAGMFTRFLLAVALAAMGLETDVRKLAGEGLRPAFLGAGAWIFISLFSLALVFTAGVTFAL